MALPLESFPFQMFIPIGQPRIITQENIKGQHTYLSSVPVRQNALQTMENKRDHPKASRVATKPGQIVSVDQLESPTPGFIAQLKGILTKQRYRYTTIFVDQYSCLSYVFLQ